MGPPRQECGQCCSDHHREREAVRMASRWTTGSWTRYGIIPKSRNTWQTATVLIPMAATPISLGVNRRAIAQTPKVDDNHNVALGRRYEKRAFTVDIGVLSADKARGPPRSQSYRHSPRCNSA